MVETLLTVLSVICTLAAIIIGYYLNIRKKLEEQALDAINDAEDTDKKGAEKMAQAVDTVWSALPVVVKPFINKMLVETIIQAVFNKVEAYAKKQVEKEKTKV